MTNGREIPLEERMLANKDKPKEVFDSDDRELSMDSTPRVMPLTVSFKKAGALIDRSSRTIKRMIERGELEELPGQSLVTYASLEAWVKRMSRSDSPPNPALEAGDVQSR